MIHSGPKYGGLPTDAVRDDASKTEDIARGPRRSVEWTDRLNQRHVVTIQRNESVTVEFPVVAGEWIWFQSSSPTQQRTGFNAAVNWVQATFSYEPEVVTLGVKRRDSAVKIISLGYRTTPADAGVIGQVKDRIKDAQEIAEAGAKTAEDIKRIYDAIKKIGS